MLKRIFDIICSLVGLILLSPIIIILAILLRIYLGTPVIFQQIRPGLKGKPFTLFKFRTMSNNTDEEGKLFPDANRISRIGHLLRSTSLDELPTLWNVLKADMSLVGPRPLLVEYLNLYTPEQARRHEVKPGITGWAQVNGRNAISWEEKFKFDLWYVNNHDFWLDIKIIIITILKVFRQDGINQSRAISMEKFQGNRKLS